MLRGDLLKDAAITYHLLVPEDQELGAIAFDRINRFVRNAAGRPTLFRLNRDPGIQCQSPLDLEDLTSESYLDIRGNETAVLNLVLTGSYRWLVSNYPHLDQPYGLDAVYHLSRECVTWLIAGDVDCSANSTIPPFSQYPEILRCLAESRCLSQDGLSRRLIRWRINSRLARSAPATSRLRANICKAIFHLVAEGLVSTGSPARVTLGTLCHVTEARAPRKSFMEALLNGTGFAPNAEECRRYAQTGNAGPAAIRDLLQRLIDTGLGTFYPSELYHFLLDDVIIAQIPKGRAGLQSRGASPRVTGSVLIDRTDDSSESVQVVMPNTEVEERQYYDALFDCIDRKLNCWEQERLAQLPRGSTGTGDQKVMKIRRLRRVLMHRRQRAEECQWDGSPFPSDSVLAKELGIPRATYSDDIGILRVIEQECKQALAAEYLPREGIPRS